MTLLEYNASPDFHQSGERLKGELREMFEGVVRISVEPFFGLQDEDQDDDEKEAKGEVAGTVEGDGEVKGMEVGDEKWGWRMVGQGEVRGFGA